MALHAAYGPSACAVGRVFCLSSFLATDSQVLQCLSRANGPFPRLSMSNGCADNVVAAAWGQKTALELQEAGVEVDFSTHEGVMHELSPRVMDRLAKWLLQV